MTMADGKKSSGKGKALTQLEKDVYETFGMLPNEDRLSFLPRYKSGEGFIAPELLYDLAKVIQSPRTAMYSELGPEEALNMALGVMGGSSVGAAPRGALQMGIAKPTLEPKRRAALMDAERALPLNLPRAPAKSQQEIAAHAERVGRQMLGEHVRSGKPKDTQNLAGRSLKESQRLKNLQYELEPLKELPPIETVQPRIGDINVAVPGDTSISDLVLKSIEGEPIGSVQQGGSLFGLGKLDRDDPLFWASNEGPAQIMQDKITDVAGLFEPERVLAQHLAMGRVANNFAQHFADASLRAIDYSKLSAKDMNTFDNVIAGGYTKKNQKTGEVQYITFPHWPGIADPEGALAAMKADPELRKWFLSRMKTPKLTQATNMPNALDIEWAITHPELRNMEVNLTGHSVGEMVPGAKLADDPDHETYLKGIRGRFLGQQENLTPFAISYPDATQHIATTQRPQDFTGTIQKVFPHQRVDQQYIDEYGEYMRQLNKFLTGRKKGGEVTMADGGQTFPLQRPELVTEVSSRKPKHPLAELLGKGVGAVHEFASKPFGYENPPGEMASSLLGLPAVATTLERFAYGEPLTRGSGETFGLRPETTEALMTALPVAGEAARLGTKGAKALAPTAREMLEAGLERAVEPTRMYAAPPGKPGKVKAPANPVGFYNPAEKAALNLQRKQGPGSAFISDMKKLEQGVNDERIAELGLDQLASKPNVTRDEVMELAEQNRIPLRESVRRPYQESDEYSETADALKESIRYREGGIQQVQAELDRVRQTAPTSPLVQQYENKIETMRQSIARDRERLEGKKPSLYGPDSHPDYNMPGGENYREIRVSLPENKADLPSMEGFTVETANENKFTGQRDIYIRDPQGNIVTNRYGFRGDDAQALRDEAASRARDVSKEDNFFHRTHHGDEPNVLFHLRVADHVDEEGKRGLLIDELQSDWHQTGREKGYKGKTPGVSWEDPEYVAARRRATELLNEYNSNNANPARQKEIEPLLNAARAEERRFTDLSNAYYKAVPDAPFKDNWYQLGLKRAIKEAADTGMDRVYLTTGARQADRYDLSKQIGALSVKPKPNGMVSINASKDGEVVIMKEVPKDQLADYVGKDMAKKAISDMDAGKDAIYSGLDLKVGGEGMKQYYDKTYKNFLEKYAKQHGGKLGMTKIADGEPVYYIDLTDAMRNSAKKGQSYKTGGAVAMAEGGAVDYESRFNEMLQKHIGMAEGGAVDYESRFNQMLQKHIGMAEGGEVNQYNSDPDMSDGGLFVAAPAFKNGGAVKSIWTVN